jgi:hypothetical protein
MVEAAGVELKGRVENKQLIDSKGQPETQEAAYTRFSSTLQVHGILQSSQVLLALSIRVQTRRTDEQYRGCSPTEPQLALLTVNCTFLSPPVLPFPIRPAAITIERSWCTGALV